MTKSRLWTALGGSLPDPSRRGSRPVLDGRPDRVLRPPPDAILASQDVLESQDGIPPQTTLPPSPGGVQTHTWSLSGPALPKTPLPEGGPNHPSRNRSQTRGVGTLVSGSRIPGTIRTPKLRVARPSVWGSVSDPELETLETRVPDPPQTHPTFRTFKSSPQLRPELGF